MCLYAMIVVRPITLSRSGSICPSAAITSSVIPSATYSRSDSGPRFSNGSTAKTDPAFGRPGVVNAIVFTGKRNRYPRFATVSMNSVPPSSARSVRLSSETQCASVASSTNVFGQRPFRKLSFSTRRPWFSTSISERVKHFRLQLHWLLAAHQLLLSRQQSEIRKLVCNLRPISRVCHSRRSP